MGLSNRWKTSWEENPLGHRTIWSYGYHQKNEIGQEVLCCTRTDALGRIAKEIYDTEQRVVKVNLYEQGELVSNREYFYDPQGQLIREQGTGMHLESSSERTIG